MAEIDFQLQVQAWLRIARTQPEGAEAWLLELQGRAVMAAAAGDKVVVSSNYKGQGQSITRELNAQHMMQITESCLQRLEAEEEAGGADQMPPIGAVRYGDFSGCSTPCDTSC